MMHNATFLCLTYYKEKRAEITLFNTRRALIIMEKFLLEEIEKDSTKFGLVFDTYYASIFGYIFRRVGDYDKSRDIASETFLKAFLNINNFKWKGISISFWLYRIANNEMMQFYRKQKYAPRSLDFIVETNGWDIVDSKTTEEEKTRLESEMRRHEDFLSIQKKIKNLPIIYQEVIALKYFEQKSIREISEILEKNEGTVKSLLSRGIEKLKKYN